MEHMGTVTINKVYEELIKIEKAMVTRDEMNNLIETIQIVSNPETMKQIIESEKNIKSGDIWEINSVSDL